MMICPRCDGQGLVKQVRVVRTDQSLCVCDECDATWRSADAVGVETWVDLGTYMAAHGLPPTWRELVVIGDASTTSPSDR